MVEKARAMLSDSIIPFWHGLRDEDAGGFYGFVDFDLNVNKKAVKGCILNSRILWFFSNAYLVLKDDLCLKDAEHAYNFLRNSCIDKENGGVYWSVKYDGSTEDTTKHTYNQAFVIYALSSYYEASKDKSALDLAFELFNVIENKCKDSGGYCESFDKNFRLESNDKLSENGVMAARTMNTLLHVFEAYSGLYRAQKDEKVKACMVKMIDVYASKIFNPEKTRLEVFFDADYNSIIDLHSYGHDIEASWLMDYGTEMLGDDSLTEKISSLNSRLAHNILSRAYHDHSIYYECEKGVDATYREWWAQAEAVVGFIHEYKKHPEKKEFFDAAKDTLSYIEDHIIDKRKGSEWFARVDENGNPVKQPIVQPWKCPYHNGRMCFEIIRRLSN